MVKVPHSAQQPESDDLQQLFMYHVAQIKQQIYTRRVQTLVENSKNPRDTEAFLSE